MSSESSSSVPSALHLASSDSSSSASSSVPLSSPTGSAPAYSIGLGPLTPVSGSLWKTRQQFGPSAAAAPQLSRIGNPTASSINSNGRIQERNERENVRQDKQ
jgi:hypothetical protein